MLTEEKTTEPITQPEIFASGGAYYIMDRRQSKQDESATTPEEEQPQPVYARRGTSRRKRESSAIGYLVSGFIAAAAGAVITVLFPIEGAAILPTQDSFFAALADRLLRCGGFLAIEYILGYFAAGGMLVWMIPPVYGLGAGLSAAAAVLSGAPLSVLTAAVDIIAVSVAAKHSAELSSLLLSIVSGSGGSIITEQSADSSYTLRFFLCLLAILAASIADAAIAVSL